MSWCRYATSHTGKKKKSSPGVMHVCVQGCACVCACAIAFSIFATDALVIHLHVYVHFRVYLCVFVFVWRLDARAEIIRTLVELDAKCTEQGRMLTEIMGEAVEDEELENHANMKLTAESLLQIFILDASEAESTCQELSTKCIEQLLRDAKTLHGCFHYYCKLAERGADVDEKEVQSKQATFLGGMETMDLDELKALILAAKLQLPKLEEAYTEAFNQTVSQLNEGDNHLGMGFVHFQECLLRLAIQLSPHWARGGGSKLSFVPEVRRKLVKGDAAPSCSVFRFLLL